jgi:hypothetical protein
MSLMGFDLVRCVPHRFLLIGVLLLTACGRTPDVQSTPSGRDEWHEFQGSWTAVGTRNILHLAGDRKASISTFSGTLLLNGPSRPSLGFRSDAIVFNDTSTGMLGRASWTDEHGEKIFSELRGEGAAAENKIVGTFVGGTGPYAGATGSYEFSWRFVLEGEEGAVEGQSTGLTGRVRIDTTSASREGEPH